MRYLLIDAANTFFRSRHAGGRHTTDAEKVGLAIHITLASINKCWRTQKADHVIFFLEGSSWRKEYYPPYKRNRVVARQAQTEAEQHQAELAFKAFDDLAKFIDKHTNCTVLQHKKAEADDLIARWIAMHPADEHVIISSDSDFVQLLAENVKQFNGVTEELITIDGIFDSKGNLVIDKKTKVSKMVPDPQWLLFEKCVRGDPTDNVFSAYPGVREKSSKNKVGLREAFNDRNHKGFSWNNLMLQRWTDHNGEEHKVHDDYERNRMLIDLTAQPEKYRKEFDEYIRKNCVKKNVTMIGAKLLKFCGKHELNRIADNATQYAEFMSASYPE
jgi:5'-3' exonuclease